MSKIEKYNRSLYESIESALRELVVSCGCSHPKNVVPCFYTSEAYEQVMTFLCLNDINHSFSLCPISSELGARVVMVTWEENGEEFNLAWWEKMEDSK